MLVITRPLGITITFTHRFLKSQDAGLFLRLEKSGQEAGIEGGLTAHTFLIENPPFCGKINFLEKKKRVDMSIRKYIFYYPLTSLRKNVFVLLKVIKKLNLILLSPQDLQKISASLWEENAVKTYGSERWVSLGLANYEKKILKDFNINKGRVLVFGSGGGRETIAFAKMAFDVDGIEICKRLNEIADDYAKKEGVRARHIAADFYTYDFPNNYYDFIHFTLNMYGCIPTRRLRISFLKRLKSVLKDGGILDLSFMYANEVYKFSWMHLFSKILAYITLGNREIERGEQDIRKSTFGLVVTYLLQTIYLYERHF